MKIKSKPIITFTEKEYKAFNEVCMMLDDLIHGDYRTALKSLWQVK